jgi:adenosylcobyric acid synthase
MRALMVQGTSSWAGKSLLVTALARALRRRDVDVVPFKAMNMSNNARVAAGGEIGTAQYLQALAAGLEPDVLMNPVLIKPEGDNRSQVVVLGRPDHELSRMAWPDRRERLWPAIEFSLRELRSRHDLVLIEGAGSPAEINLRAADLANMRTARAADARVLLVADINRGGAFAHLYGTWALLAGEDRARLLGFVLNRFRGDASLLTGGTEELRRLTGVPTLGVVPWFEHGLPDEDGAATPAPVPFGAAVAVVRYPTASNLDEFKPLEQLRALRWAGGVADIAGAQLVVLPGSKHVAADLAWLHRTGLAQALRERAARGGAVLGICGGLQRLGERVDDEVDGSRFGSAEGLALLPLRTTFMAGKRTERSTGRFEPLPEPWAALSDKTLVGYEIRRGRTIATGAVREALSNGLGFAAGAVLGIYLHGLFEQPELVRALLGAAPSRSLEQTFEHLADLAEEHLDVDALIDTAVLAP